MPTLSGTPAAAAPSWAILKLPIAPGPMASDPCVSSSVRPLPETLMLIVSTLVSVTARTQTP